MSFYDIKYNRIFISYYGGEIMSTNLSKIKRDKMLDTISKIKGNVTDEDTLSNMVLFGKSMRRKLIKN